MTFTYEITLRIQVVEDNPDMPSMNINALAGYLRDHTCGQLTGGSFNAVVVSIPKAGWAQ